ncbi:tetratricopeptide repeat protein 4 [Phthorimaea operculella]|nr:tetratricopeptide repeat protein 4 [Phthorimaea operculella]
MRAIGDSDVASARVRAYKVSEPSGCPTLPRTLQGNRASQVFDAFRVFDYTLYVPPMLHPPSRVSDVSRMSHVTLFPLEVRHCIKRENMSEEAPKAAEPKKTPMTDEERMALARKLDQELDDFINGLEKKRYTDGWSEDTWEEEMDKHPFFMKSTPDGEMSPLAEGLAKLKLAILGYTEGIKVKCDDPELNASLYNNRAAAHWHLKNYRSALADSEKALTFNPDHSKARLRAAKCAFEIGKYDKCIEHCEKLLETQKGDKEITGIITAAKKKKMIQERDQRKKERSEQKSTEQKEDLIKAIKERKIRISKCEDEDDIDLAVLEPHLPNAQDSMVHIKDGILYWPVLFLYPEFQMTDFIKDCPENVPLKNQLEQVFPAPWDKENNYSIDKVNVYFEGWDSMPHIVDIKMNLGDLLVKKYFILKAGTPCFIVVPRGSAVEKGFLETFI